MMVKIPRIRHTEHNVAEWFIVLLIAVSVYGGYFAKTSGVDSLYAQIVLIMCIGMLAIKKGISINRRIAFPLLLCISVCVVQSIIHLPAMEPIRNLMYLVVFLCIAIISNENTWGLIRKALIVISVIMTIDALVNLPKVIAINYGWYNVRNYTMVDKPFYSLILTFAVVFMILDIFYKRVRHVIFPILLIAVELFVNTVVIQSKAGILCLAGVIVLLSIIAPKKIRIKIIAVAVIVFVAVLYMCIARPDIIPDYIKVMANRYLGLFDESITGYSKYIKTYDLRADIYRVALEIFLVNPWLGIGFGKYAIYGAAAVGVTETESSIINTFVEGGVIYGLSHCAIVLLLLLKLFKMSKRNHWYGMETEVFLIILLYFVFNFQNDYISTMYWCIMGISYRIAFKVKI